MTTTASIPHTVLILGGLLGLACGEPKPSDTDSASSVGSTDGTNATTTPTTSTSTSTSTAGDSTTTTTTQDTGTSTTSSTVTSTTSSTGTSSTGTSSTGTTTTTTDTVGDTEESTDSGVDPVCQASGVAFTFALVPPLPDSPGDVAVDWDCTVVDIVPTAETLELDLECTSEGEPVTPSPQVVLSGTPAPESIGLLPDDEIHLRYERLAPFWTEEALRIDKPGNVLVLAASHASALNPFEDIALGSIEAACPPIDEGCGPILHESITLELEGGAGDINSREFAQIGKFGVWAQRLTHFTQPPPQCTDIPAVWRSLALLRLVE